MMTDGRRYTDKALFGWLERLERRRFDQVAMPEVRRQCIERGWAEWDIKTVDGGEPITEAAAIERWGQDWFKHVIIGKRERLTPKGRQALLEYYG